MWASLQTIVKYFSDLDIVFEQHIPCKQLALSGSSEALTGAFQLKRFDYCFVMLTSRAPRCSRQAWAGHGLVQSATARTGPPISASGVKALVRCKRTKLLGVVYQCDA
jgi:hypothetical protein